MAFMERNISGKITSLIMFLTFAVFTPILVYAVYQSVTLMTRAAGVPADITVLADIPDTGIPALPHLGSGESSPSGIVSIIGRVTGTRLTVTGNGTWTQAVAAKDHTTFMVAVWNTDPYRRYAMAVPVVITGLTAGTFQNSLTYLREGGCAVNEQPRTTQSESGRITVILCLEPGNAALWKLTKLPR